MTNFSPIGNKIATSCFLQPPSSAKGRYSTQSRFLLLCFAFLLLLSWFLLLFPYSPLPSSLSRAQSRCSRSRPRIWYGCSSIPFPYRTIKIRSSEQNKLMHLQLWPSRLWNTTKECQLFTSEFCSVLFFEGFLCVVVYFYFYSHMGFTLTAPLLLTFGLYLGL